MKKQKLKPTHHYTHMENGEEVESLCTHLTIVAKVDRNTIIVAIGNLIELRERNITREKVEEHIASLLKHNGEGFFCDSYVMSDVVEDKAKIFAEKLFPDWFKTQSIQYIIEEE